VSESGIVKVYNADTGRGVIVPNQAGEEPVIVDAASLSDDLALLLPGQSVRFRRNRANSTTCDRVELDTGAG
jgi:cold shock CspA family protein